MSSPPHSASKRDPFEDFTILTELFAVMIESQQGQPLSSEDGWINHAQILAMKLFKQSCSVRVILNTTQLDFQDGQKIVFVDHSSATILTRACLETFIVFHWIFQSQDSALRKFRHGVWRLGGLMDRLKLHPSTEHFREKLKTTRLQVAEQVAEIEASPFLGTYKPEHAKRLLKGDWRVGWSWTDEAVRAGFNRKYFQNVYSHFCGYAHSSYISSVQMGEAQSIADQRMLGLVALQTSVHVMARAVSFYAELFPRGRAALEAASDKVRGVAYLWGFTSTDMEHLFEEPKNDGV
jgi:AraC-like DNA-binding protein